MHPSPTFYKLFGLLVAILVITVSILNVKVFSLGQAVRALLPQKASIKLRTVNTPSPTVLIPTGTDKDFQKLLSTGKVNIESSPRTYFHEGMIRVPQAPVKKR